MRCCRTRGGETGSQASMVAQGLPWGFCDARSPHIATITPTESHDNNMGLRINNCSILFLGCWLVSGDLDPIRSVFKPQVFTACPRLGRLEEHCPHCFICEGRVRSSAGMRYGDPIFSKVPLNSPRFQEVLFGALPTAPLRPHENSTTETLLVTVCLPSDWGTLGWRLWARASLCVVFVHDHLLPEQKVSTSLAGN